MSVSVLLSIFFYLCVCVCIFLGVCVSCAFKCGSMLFHPPLVAIQLLTTEGKVRVLQTKRQNVLTGASSDKRSEECGLKEGRVQGKQIHHKLPGSNEPAWLADQHSSILFLPFFFLLSFPSAVSFSLPFFFSEGCLPLKHRELIFSSFLFPPNPLSFI